MDTSKTHLSFSNPSIYDIGKLVEEHKEDDVYNDKKGIYVLECDKRSLGKTKSFGSKIGSKKRIPNWVWPAHGADKRYYVGSSKHVGYRICQHVHQDGAQFTMLFPPKSIKSIEWISRSKDNLQQKERDKGNKLKNETDDEVFVYQA